MPRWAAARAIPGAVLGASVALALSGAACLDPSKDFNDYIARAADASLPPSSIVTPEASTPDAALLHAPDAAFMDSKYVMGCLSFLATDPSQIFLFDLNLSYTPSAGGGGTITSWQSQSLPNGATSTSQAIGNVLSLSGSIAKDGTGKLSASGVVTIPAAANPLDGQDVTLQPLSIDLHVFADKSACGQLDGNITAPVPAVLTPVNNPCVIKPAPGGNVPTFSAADYHCP